jgi:hypothetical protein
VHSLGVPHTWTLQYLGYDESFMGSVIGRSDQSFISPIPSNGCHELDFRSTIFARFFFSNLSYEKEEYWVCKRKVAVSLMLGCRQFPAIWIHNNKRSYYIYQNGRNRGLLALNLFTIWLNHSKDWKYLFLVSISELIWLDSTWELWSMWHLLHYRRRGRRV